MTGNLILRVVTKMLTPFILLFALYVQFHGHLGPGGGFQAGVVFGTGLILYALIFGVAKAEALIPRGLLRFGIASGVLIYASVGLVGVFGGSRYLDYSVLSHDPVHGQELGIALIELGVGITVASVMTSIFVSFASWREERP